MTMPNWLRRLLGLPDPTLVDPRIADLQAQLAAAEGAAAASRLHAMDATRQLQQSVPAPVAVPSTASSTAPTSSVVDKTPADATGASLPVQTQAPVVAGIVVSSAPPTEDNLTAYGHQNIPTPTEIPGFVSFGLNMQPPATSVGQAYTKWNAAIAQRNTNASASEAFQPGGEAFNLGGVDYMASTVLARYNDLPEPKQAAALADPVIENALVVKLGRYAANQIVNRLRAGGAPGSYDYTSGFMTWFDSAGRHDEQVGQLY